MIRTLIFVVVFCTTYHSLPVKIDGEVFYAPKSNEPLEINQAYLDCDLLVHCPKPVREKNILDMSRNYPKKCSAALNQPSYYLEEMEEIIKQDCPVGIDQYHTDYRRNKVPLYEKKVSLIMNMLTRTFLNLDGIIFQQEVLEHTKKPTAFWVFAFLYNPELLLGWGAKEYLDCLNKEGEDIPWTPGFALVKNINFQFKNWHYVQDKRCLERCLDALRQMIPTHLDIHKLCLNYSLSKSSKFAIFPQNITMPKKRDFASPAYYIEKWYIEYRDRLPNDTKNVLGLLYERAFE